jgi:hypothetical protein
MITQEHLNIDNALADHISMDDISDKAGYLQSGNMNNHIKSTPRFKHMYSKESFPNVNIDENNSSKNHPNIDYLS